MATCRRRPDPNAPQLMVGVWMGNSDHSPPASSDQVVFALDGPGQDLARVHARLHARPADGASSRRRRRAWCRPTSTRGRVARPGPWTTRDAASSGSSPAPSPAARTQVDPGRPAVSPGVRHLVRRHHAGRARTRPARGWKRIRGWMARARTGEGVASASSARPPPICALVTAGAARSCRRVCFVTPPPPPTLPARPIRHRHPTPPPGQTPHPHPTPAPEPTPKPKPTHKP